MFRGNVENCVVKGDIEIEGCWYMGGILGNAYANVINCSVIGNEGSYIRSGGGNYVGGIMIAEEFSAVPREDGKYGIVNVADVTKKAQQIKLCNCFIFKMCPYNYIS